MISEKKNTDKNHFNYKANVFFECKKGRDDIELQGVWFGHTFLRLLTGNNEVVSLNYSKTIKSVMEDHESN